MHLLDTEPQGVVAPIFRWIKRLPLCAQTPTLTFLHLFFGAAKKTWILEGGRLVVSLWLNMLSGKLERYFFQLFFIKARVV